MFISDTQATLKDRERESNAHQPGFILAPMRPCWICHLEKLNFWQLPESCRVRFYIRISKPFSPSVDCLWVFLRDISKIKVDEERGVKRCQCLGISVRTGYRAVNECTFLFASCLYSTVLLLHLSWPRSFSNFFLFNFACFFLQRIVLIFRWRFELWGCLNQREKCVVRAFTALRCLQ